MAHGVDYAALFNILTSSSYRARAENLTMSQMLLKAEEAGGKYLESDEFEILKDAVARYPEFADSIILDTTWESGGAYNSETIAATFQMPDGSIYVSYCGTGDGGWIDNGQGVTKAYTHQQEEATRYFDEMAGKYGWNELNNITVTGHSKGGNKAQYITLMAEQSYLIDTCYSMDGQGFSDAAIQMFRQIHGEEGYEKVLEKMRAINGNNDFVNPLINPIIPTEQTIYLQTTTVEDGGIGEVYAGYHMLKNYFQSRNDEYIAVLAPEGEQETMGRLAKELSEYLMSLPIEEQNAAGMVIMQFIETVVGEDDGQTGEVITNQLVSPDGDHLTVDELITFLSKDMLPIIWKVLRSESGREVLWDLLQRFIKEKPMLAVITVPAIIFLAPVIVTLLFSISELAALVQLFQDVLEGLGRMYDKARKILQSWKESLKELGEGLIDLFRGKSQKDRGIGAWYCVDSIKMREIQEELDKSIKKLETDVQKIRKIRREIDFGILIQEAFYFKITAVAWNLERRIGNLQNMRNALCNCIDRYEDNENQIMNCYEQML